MTIEDSPVPRKPSLPRVIRLTSKLVLTALGPVLAVSCATSNADSTRPRAQLQPSRQVLIVVTDDVFDMPRQLESEPVNLTLQNDGKGIHRAYIARLNQGVTEKQVRSALSKGPDAHFSLITLAGGMPETEPGGGSEVGMLFPAGHYLVIDPEVEGPPPMAFFAVVRASGPVVREPAADYSIEAGDFYFKISDPQPGEAMVEITNVGEQGHEVSIGRGATGQGVTQVEALEQALEEVTTVFAPAPGGKMWVTVTLEAGAYTLVCFQPDPATGKPHVKLGMKQSFSVR